MSLVEVKKLNIIYDDEKNMLCVKPLKIFLGKCDVRNMLLRIGALEEALFNRNTILLEIS